MPGSEGGNRVHNFFHQEKCIYQHSQQQVVDGSRLVTSGFHWHGNQRRESSPVNFSPEHTASDLDRGNLNRQSSLVHSSSFLESPQRPTFSVSPNILQHTSLNGYIQDHHPVQAKHEETDFMGMNKESSQQNPFSRRLLNSGAQFRNLSEQHRNVRQETLEIPVNFDLLGSHRQLNSQLPGMLQSSPRQQSGLNDRQLLQQQAMLRNLYDVQRQQQLQKQDTRPMNTVNNLSVWHQRPSVPSPSNSTYFQDRPNNARMSQHGTGNSNWLQGVVPPVMHETSNGISFSTDKTAPPYIPAHISGFSPQSVDHSLYGEIKSRFDFQYNNNLPNASSQVSYHGTVMGNLSQADSQQRSPMEFLGIQGVSSSSIKSKENTLPRTVILQDAAPLDPTEEQFLFGSDDNIWDAFGKSSNSKLDDYKTVEGAEFQNQFSSMQSGSWSALMQSALAETCSTNLGNQEEWPGFNISGEPADAGHESLAFISSEKQRTSDTNEHLHLEPALDANYMSLDKAGATNSRSMQGFPWYNLSGSSDVNEMSQFNSASKSSQQVSESNMHPDHSNMKARTKENLIHSKSGHHQAAVQNLKGPSGAFAPQHGSQVYNRSSHDSYMGSAPCNSSPVRLTFNENIMNPRHDRQKGFMHEEMQKAKSDWTQNSSLNPLSPTVQENSNSHITSDPTITSSQDYLNGSQNPPISHLYNHWKHVGSIPEVRSENGARVQNHPGAHPHVLDSSFNSSDKNNQLQSSFWEITSGNKSNDTFVPGQHSPNAADGMIKASDQVAECSPGIRKYQYHSSGQGPKSSKKNDKGKASKSHTDMRESHKGFSVGQSLHHSTNKTFQSSQNMVEHFNKAGQSRENSAEASRNSSDQNMLSEKPAAESSDTSMPHFQEKHFIGSKTYSLQLSPPHQRFPTQSRGTSPAPSSLGLNAGQFLPHHKSGISQTELNDASSGFSEQNGDSASVHKMQEHYSASFTPRPPDLVNQLQNQFLRADAMLSHLDHTDNMPSEASINQSSVLTQFNAAGGNMNRAPPHSSLSQADKNIQSNLRPKHAGFPSEWTSVPIQQGSSEPDIFTTQTHMKTFVVPVKKNELNPTVSGIDLPGSRFPNTVFSSESSGEDQRAIGRSWKSGTPDETDSELKSAIVLGKDGFPFSDVVTRTNHVNSGNSIKSDVKPQNSYSLLHQLQVMRSAEIDPNNRDSKRLKVQSITDTEAGISKLAVSGDSKLGSFISVPSTDHGRYFPSQHGSVLFQSTPTIAPNDSQIRQAHNGSRPVSGKLHTHISPQMAPNWFERYGTLSREQLVPASDVWKHSHSRPLELRQTHENCLATFPAQSLVQQVLAPSVPIQVGDMKNCSAPEHVVIESSSSPQMAALTSSCPVSLVPLNLKAATIELLPWYKEVTQLGLQGLPNISASEVKWANATKRIPEKVMDEVEQADNRTAKCKRRLVLTTQLVQHLLDPPTASVMSSDANMNYESVVYFTSRLSCGSACSLTGSQNHRFMSLDHSNMIYKKEPEQVDELLSIVENDFLARASKLENALSGLEKQTSIQDLRIEWQDLEKFSVINRFAKFHGRGQADGPAITNSAMNPQNYGPQRYVTALPSPGILPDTVQCLSL